MDEAYSTPETAYVVATTQKHYTH